MQKTHGQAGTNIYNRWQKMLSRCRNPQNKDFPYYGGRGIAVCDRWLKFENFFADTGTPPTPQHTLDRIDNDGGYNPENCRWATPNQQSNNRRYCHLLTLNGQTLNIQQWASLLHVKKSLIYGRIRSGWTEEQALTFPLGTRQRGGKLTRENIMQIKCLLAEGKSHKEIGDVFHLHPGTIGHIKHERMWKEVVPLVLSQTFEKTPDVPFLQKNMLHLESVRLGDHPNTD